MTTTWFSPLHQGWIDELVRLGYTVEQAEAECVFQRDSLGQSDAWFGRDRAQLRKLER
jgi:hypothetical protein